MAAVEDGGVRRAPHQIYLKDADTGFALGAVKMRLLLCCEFYHPSVGGVQEVMRQIAQRMALLGHSVTVATSRLAERDFTCLNGVQIESFAVQGNAIRGMTGEVDRYRQFVTGFPADAILIKAAQQWTFDALWPDLDRIKARKVFIPCGFSGLYDPACAAYFGKMPDILRKFDHLIFYAERYRDIDFAKSHGLDNWSIVPNGADEAEFATDDDGADLRRRLGVAPDTFLFSTVGSVTGAKGHAEVAAAYARIKESGRPSCLVLNGRVPHAGLRKRAAQAVKRWIPSLSPVPPLELSVKAIEGDPMKRVIQCDLSRPDVVKLFKTSDLFVFASNVEYSPLVLYEAAAAGTAFLTVPVGNAEEIVRWTGGGILCPAPVDGKGLVRADPDMLAGFMTRAMADGEAVAKVGEQGRRSWREKFTWEKIALSYQAILKGEGR